MSSSNQSHQSSVSANIDPLYAASPASQPPEMVGFQQPHGAISSKIPLSIPIGDMIDTPENLNWVSDIGCPLSGCLICVLVVTVRIACPIQILSDTLPVPLAWWLKNLR